LSHRIDIRSITSPVATELMTNTITGGSMAGVWLASNRSNRRERLLVIIFVVNLRALVSPHLLGRFCGAFYRRQA
jgi:hypothetical protein